MARRECLDQNPDCYLPPKKRKSIGHHEYYPRRDYPTELEKAFRNLGCNITQRCVCIETDDPHISPKPKPSIQEMMRALTIPLEGVEYDQAA